MSKAHPSPGPADVPSAALAAASAGRRYRDLCSTCNHVEACGGRSTPQSPIFFCEQFEAFAPVPPRAPSAPRPASTSSAGGDYAGLCMNCENRETCGLPHPAGGVWHCGEYR